jgi:hypothetical protein
MTIKPLTKRDVQAARRAWKYTLEQGPKRQATMLALWASVWAEPLMRAAEDQVKRTPPNPDT